jgi:hypothetical protein
LPWLVYSQVHQLRNWIVNEDTVTAAHLRSAAPLTGHVVRAMVDRWPGAHGPAGLLLTLAVVPAALLAVRSGHGRAVAFVAVVVALDVAVLVAQFVVAARAPAEPVARDLLDGLLRVTVYRVALVPASLLMVAVPLLAGLGGRRGQRLTATRRTFLPTGGRRSAFWMPRLTGTRTRS